LIPKDNNRKTMILFRCFASNEKDDEILKILWRKSEVVHKS